MSTTNHLEKGSPGPDHPTNSVILLAVRIPISDREVSKRNFEETVLVGMSVGTIIFPSLQMTEPFKQSEPKVFLKLELCDLLAPVVGCV